MTSRLNWQAIQPIAVLVLGTLFTAVALASLFPERGMDMDEQATLQCPTGYVAVVPAEVAGASVERVAQLLQTPDGERVCVDLQY